MLFSKLGADSISLEILLYVADSAYYSTSAQEINFNSFTGFFVFFDIGLHFKYGVNMVNGSPVGPIIDVHMGSAQQLSNDRADIYCFIVLEEILVECIAFSDCVSVLTIEGLDCVSFGGGGGGGGNGGGNGSGSGGGTGGNTGGGGGGGGGSYIDTTTNLPYDFYEEVHYSVIFSVIPVHIFVQGGGNLPPTLNVEKAIQLVQMNNSCHFSLEQRNWLVSNSNYIGIFHGYLNNHAMSAAAIQTVMETLTAMMNNGNQVLLGALQILLQVQDGANFTAVQLNWLINHQDVLKACSIFQ